MSVGGWGGGEKGVRMEEQWKRGGSADGCGCNHPHQCSHCLSTLQVSPMDVCEWAVGGGGGGGVCGCRAMGVGSRRLH